MVSKSPIVIKSCRLADGLDGSLAHTHVIWPNSLNVLALLAGVRDPTKCLGTYVSCQRV